MHLSSGLPAALMVASTYAAVIRRDTYPPVATVENVLQLEPASWLENIAVRSDGTILASRLDVPSVILFDPNSGSQSEIASFANVTGAFGIAEYAPDVFAVAVGNFSTQNLAPVPGTYSIQTIDLNNRTDNWSIVEPEILAEVPAATNLNGLTFRAPSTLYAADSFGFQIYAIDTETRTAAVALPEEPLFSSGNSTNSIAAGVNGLKWDESRQLLFFSNSNQVIAGSIPTNGTALGSPTQIAAGGYVGATDFDDFAIDGSGNLYFATGPTNSIVFVNNEFKLESTIDEEKGSTTIPLSPTAAAFGRGQNDTNVLYVTTSGGGHGAQIVAYRFN